MLEESVSSLKGIGPKKALILKAELGVETVEDLIYYRPRKYVDRSTFKAIKDCFLNEEVTIEGVITNKRLAGRQKRFLEVMISDGTDTLNGIFFGGINYFNRLFNIGDRIFFSGKISFYKNKQMVHPDFDFIDVNSAIQTINTGRIIPLYRSSEKLSSAGFDSRGFRRIIKQIINSYLDTVQEPFQDSLLRRNSLIGIKEALVAIHFPENLEQIEPARRRIAFNELFFLQYYISITKKSFALSSSKKPGPQDLRLFQSVLKDLPFSLTDDQKKSLEEIKNDIVKSVPMSRMLQGDVGSGKTVVALLSACISIGSGCQVSFMAPTEVLANQHYNSFKQMLGEKVCVNLLTGSTAKEDKQKIYDSVRGGEIDILIGTHALIQDTVEFHKLGLIIIDEQHRFGVEQRATLRKKGLYADLLVMTATPIPRSLSMTLYGDLDISVIRQKPSHRIPIKTLALPASKLDGVYRSLEKYISQGRQVYYVLPLIEESEKIDLKSAIEVYNNLRETHFPHRRVSLLHGRMDKDEKDSVMNDYKFGQIDILVTTTVIEVGIDVPNASVIVIEHAERFGLSQLHQLRGRVGRGYEQSYCVMVYPDSLQEEQKNRINTIVETDDGFEIAEKDLQLRGAGELLGVKQHGRDSGFEFAELTSDYDLILRAKEESSAYVNRSKDETGELRVPVASQDELQQHIRMKRILSLIS